MNGPIRWLRIILGNRRQGCQQSAKQLTSQRVSYPFALVALAFFSLQGLIALLGSVDLIIADLPSLIPFQTGRAIHLNLSIIWPVLGGIGASIYWFIKETERDLLNTWPVSILFYLFVLTAGSILASLALGFTEGKEYMEAIRPFDYALALNISLFTGILFSNYLRRGIPHTRPVLISLLAGAMSLTIFFIPNLFNYAHPTTEEVVRFWVVHLWEELSLELIAASITAGLLISILPGIRSNIEKILIFELGLAATTALFSTGHHYYWVGVPGYWLWVGAIFSMLQVIPIILMAISTVYSMRKQKWSQLAGYEQLALAFLLSSLVYHLTGAGSLGAIMSIPQWNAYAHGTYLTSAHAHLALFGVMGMLILGSCYYILASNMQPTPREITYSWFGFILINTGLMVMGGSLLIAGGLQIYLWRLVGLEFNQVHQLLSPYLALRTAGGSLFAGGGIIFFYSIVTMSWRSRRQFIAAR